MDPQFWFEALRDLALLAAGSVLTLLGAVISNAYSRRRDAEARAEELGDKVEERQRNALERSRESVFELYVDARDQSDAGERSRIKFDAASLLDAESRAYMIADADLRAVVIGVLGALRGLGAAVENGTLHGAPVHLQVQSLYSALQLLSAKLRGENTLPAKHLEFAREVGEKTAKAWADLIKSGNAERA